MLTARRIQTEKKIMNKIYSERERKTMKPNILFIMSDQHNAGSLGCCNHPNVRTPNLDGLANKGIRFEHAFCNNPICSPWSTRYLK